METIYMNKQYSKALPLVNTGNKREMQVLLDKIRQEVIDYITPVDNPHTITTEYIDSLFEKAKKVLL